MNLRYFKMKEFRCPCCAVADMETLFLEKIDEARHIAQIPFLVTSGWRCEKKQEELRRSGYQTSNGISPHQKGVAADIRVRNDKERYAIINAWFAVGGNRFGIAKNFIHLDVDFDRRPYVTWMYS